MIRNIKTQLETRQYLVSLQKALLKVDTEPVAKAIEAIKEAGTKGGIVYTFGNGGSAATASHFANDLLKVGEIGTVCISDMNPTQLAYMNDDGKDVMWSHPLNKLIDYTKDVVLAISCSGNSENVVECVSLVHEYRNSNPCPVIALTGDEGGHLGSMADIVIRAPHPDIRIQEDIHLAICHIISSGIN